jgi:hypothetical protein
MVVIVTVLAGIRLQPMCIMTHFWSYHAKAVSSPNEASSGMRPVMHSGKRSFLRMDVIKHIHCGLSFIACSFAWNVFLLLLYVRMHVISAWPGHDRARPCSQNKLRVVTNVHSFTARTTEARTSSTHFHARRVCPQQSNGIQKGALALASVALDTSDEAA